LKRGHPGIPFFCALPESGIQARYCSSCSSPIPDVLVPGELVAFSSASGGGGGRKAERQQQPRQNLQYKILSGSNRA